MRFALLLFPALVALTGCNAQPASPSVAENEAEMRNAAADLKGADRLFGFPSEAVGHLNQFGFRLAPYATAKNGFAAIGSPITLSQSGAKSPNVGTVGVTGATADTIDTVAFTLPVTDDANAATARKRLSDIVRAFLFQYGIKDEGALDAIAAEKPFAGEIGAIPTTVAIDKGATPRRITVTFQRPTATAPTEPAGNIIQQP